MLPHSEIIEQATDDELFAATCIASMYVSDTTDRKTRQLEFHKRVKSELEIMVNEQR